MTFDEIVSEVCEKLNLTSDESRSRVGRCINTRYRRLTSSIGLSTSRYGEVSTLATLGDPTLIFSNVEKIFNVIDKTDPDTPVILTNVTKDELTATSVRQQPPRKYAILTQAPTSVTIKMDCVPAAPLFTLHADALVTVTTLSSEDKPNFPESFHDILVIGAMADEYRKMEKFQFYKDAESDYESRSSDLRMFIAKNAYLDIFQGKNNLNRFRWTRDAQLAWEL